MLVRELQRKEILSMCNFIAYMMGTSWGAPPCKDTSWWNEEEKDAIKIKRNSYRDLKKYCDEVSFEKYKLAKEAKKAVQNTRAKVYKKVCEKLATKKLKRIYIELLE